MGKRFPSNGEYLNKFREVHGDEYEYPNFLNKELDKRAHTKIDIECKIHGVWSTTTINSHLNGVKCTKCSRCTPVTGKQWLKRLKKKWGDTYIYPDYFDTDDIIKAKDEGYLECRKHGIFRKDTYNLCKSGCPKCAGLNRTHEEFIELLIKNNKHFREGALECVSKYVDTNTPILLKDKYGVFKVNPRNILRKDSLPNIKSIIDKDNYYINQYKEIYGDRYSYDKFKYKGAGSKSIITCNKHNIDFKQKPYLHLKYNGCPKCYSEYSTEREIENPSGWRYTKWKERAKKSKNFDSFKVYIIRCWNDEEEFYKIGKTFKTIDGRFGKKPSNKTLPYNREIVKIFSHKRNYKQISELENRLKNINKEFRYVPLIHFHGMYECFSEVHFEE